MMRIAITCNYNCICKCTLFLFNCVNGVHDKCPYCVPGNGLRPWKTAMGERQQSSSSLSSSLCMKGLREADNHQNKIKYRTYCIILSAKISNREGTEKSE